MPDLGYRSGEIVTWTTASEDSTERLKETRPVFFVSYEDAQSALISYGLKDGQPRHVKVLISELSREEPPPLDPTYFPNGKPYSTPQPKPPLTDDQISQRLLSARTKLAAAHERAAIARELAALARTLADRSDTEIARVRTELRQLQQQDDANTREVELALREGREPTFKHHPYRSVLEARIKSLEATNSKFTDELISTNRRLTDALDDVKSAARQVLTVLISREAENLRKQIANVCLKFTELTSAAELNLGTTTPLLLDSATADLLSTSVIVPKENLEARRTSTESRTSKWRELWVKLLEGQTDADVAD